jgi:hypothetical protein
MKLTHRLTAGALTIALSAGIALMPVSARASEEGRRNTALGLGAAAAYLLLKEKNTTLGLGAAAGAAYAYKRYNDKVQERRRDDRYGYYGRDDRYDSRYDTRYDSRYDTRYDTRYDRRDDRYDSRYDTRYDDRYDRDRYSRTSRTGRDGSYYYNADDYRYDRRR